MILKKLLLVLNFDSYRAGRNSKRSQFSGILKESKHLASFKSFHVPMLCFLKSPKNLEKNNIREQNFNNFTPSCISKFIYSEKATQI